MDASRQWVAAELPSGTRVTWNKAVSTDTMTRSNGRQYAHVTLEEPVTGSMSLKAGDRVWTVCDRGNLVPARDSATRPAWWSPFLPPSRETVQFDTVVCPTPYPIKAGDPVGHLGYFQVPTEDGHEKRYQVHIECLTTDDLPRFLSNPEGVGRDTPLPEGHTSVPAIQRRGNTEGTGNHDERSGDGAVRAGDDGQRG
ncbi:hypothetical protein [Citrobacter portucalensis]|uniref:hypothetical protein n=1 Tax=Citrobacter portucalensis TaxID=1639133 RepID=UPI00288B87B0|nr:hypothetical protein [Citrobacter portucalensis]WNI84137.1 hypothetical protein RIK60_00365 [Citrobacter portucalensis]